ncbi:ArnT family glycosyltransferase, partial [Thermodesulfobacteriota bacterium]
MFNNKNILLWIVSFAALCIIFTNQLTLRNFPNSADEYSYILAAKTFAEGVLSVPSPEYREFFNIYHVINDGKFYSKYSPGWPFFLMIGELSGFPAFSNLCFAILTLIITYKLSEMLFSERVAIIASLLMATNSYFIFNSSSYFAHSSSHFFLLLFVYLYFRTYQTLKLRLLFLPGFVLGIAFLVRPLDAVIFGSCVFFYDIIIAFKDKSTPKNALVGWLALTPGLIISVIILLHYNHIQTGEYSLMTFNRYNPNDTIGLQYPYYDSFKWALEN